MTNRERPILAPLKLKDHCAYASWPRDTEPGLAFECHTAFPLARHYFSFRCLDLEYNEDVFELPR